MKQHSLMTTTTLVAAALASAGSDSSTIASGTTERRSVVQTIAIAPYRIAALKHRFGPVLHRRGPDHSTVRCERAGTGDRRFGDVRTWCTVGVAHPPARADAYRHGRHGPGQRWGDALEEIRSGDVIWIPPGQKHWHGAAPTTGMTHIAIQEQLGGKNVEWLEHVTDEQYGKRQGENP